MRRAPSLVRTLLVGALGLGVLGFGVARPAGAQVGHDPASSPYEDLRGRQAATIGIGTLAPGRDPAGVAPKSGVMLTGRYELQLTRPLWFFARLGVAPSLERPIKDPLFTDAQRDAGTERHPMLLTEVGLTMNLTGNKSWRRIVPQFHSAIGFVTDGNTKFVLGGYKFGSAFTISYGLGARVTTGRDWELHADLTRVHWKYTYPDAYGTGSDPLVPSGRLGPWVGNSVMQIGVSRFFFR